MTDENARVKVSERFARIGRENPGLALAVATMHSRVAKSVQSLQIDEATNDLRLASVTPVDKEELVVDEVNRRGHMFKESFADPMAPGRYGSTWRSMAMKSVYEDIVAGRWLV